MGHPEHEEVGVALLRLVAQAGVELNHVVLAVQRDLVAAQGLAQFSHGGNDAVKTERID